MKRSTLIFLTSAFALALLPIGLASANGTLSIGAVTPSANVSAGTNISLQINNSGFISNPHYTTTDSFPGSTLSNSDINSAGLLNWTPSTVDVGTHNVIFTATDSYNEQSSLTQTFVIGQASPVSVQSLSPGNNIFPNNVLSFNIAAPGFVNPVFSISDSFSGSTLNNTDISSSGIVTWKPSTSDIGIHNLTVNVSASGGRTETVYQTITVDGIGIQNVSASSVPAGSIFTFAIVPYGLDTPTYNVNDTIGNSAFNSNNINNNIFSWTPGAGDMGAHTISITATDINGNVSTAKVGVTVTSGGSINPITTTNSNTTTTANVPSDCINGALFSASTGQACPAATTSNTTSTVTAPSDIFVSYLKVGSSGNEVIDLQNLLTRLGYFSGPVTGTFGSKTEASVKAFQKAKGIAQLGAVGPATRTALNSYGSTSTTSSGTSTHTNSTTSSAVGDGFVFTKALALGASGTEVTELQKRLAIDGYFTATPNGNFGPLTKTAVEKFQKAKGITVQGNVGPATRTALNK